jgi:hypothetical protein
VLAKRLLIAAVAVLGMSACTTSNVSAPDLVGPSAMGLTLDITASPDQMFRDGLSQSTIEVTATDSSGRRVTDLNLMVAASPNLGTIQAPSIKTNASGKASTVFVAPGAGGTTTTTITVTPGGSNYQNVQPRTITIRLFQPVS